MSDREINTEARGARARAHWAARPWVVLALVWVVAAAFVGRGLDRGWFPHDEGTLSQSAERVLGGELPHRDFDEIYTGGLTYVNAAAFRVLGTNLVSLRVVLFAVFLAWVPALYYVATRFAPPPTAGLVVLLGAAWSLPNYSAAMPSWYNLFCATFGLGAVLRYLETDRRRWLIAAGVAGGLSCLVKIVGLYYVAGVLLCLVFREGELAGGPSRGPWKPARIYAVAIGAALVCLVGLLVWLVHTEPRPAEVLHFVLPGAALAALVYRASTTSGGASAARFRALARLLGPFALGVAVPVAGFVLVYAWSGAIPALVHGVFLEPTRRFAFATEHLPSAANLLNGLVVAILLGIVSLPRLPAQRVLRALLMLALVAFLIFSKNPVWYSIRPLVPLAVLVGVWRLWGGAPGLSSLRRQQLVLVLGVTALASLVQVPFAVPIYFFYVAPLAAIMVLALVQAEAPRPAYGAAAVLALYLVRSGVPDPLPGHDRTARLALARGGIEVPVRDQARYQALVTSLTAHARGGYAYAGPDCPEVYFLAGLRNPTRTIYEFLDDSAARTDQVLEALADHRVTAVAINERPLFSGPLPAELVDSLRARYPLEQPLDGFVVRWRP